MPLHDRGYHRHQWRLDDVIRVFQGATCAISSRNTLVTEIRFANQVVGRTYELTELTIRASALNHEPALFAHQCPLRPRPIMDSGWLSGYWSSASWLTRVRLMNLF